MLRVHPSSECHPKRLLFVHEMSSLHSRRAPKLEPKPKSKQTKTNNSLKVKGPSGSLRKAPNNLQAVESPSSSGVLSSKSSSKSRCTLKQKALCGVILLIVLFIYIKWTNVIGGDNKDDSIIRSFLRGQKHSNTDAKASPT